jgi:hypothetical protein
MDESTNKPRDPFRPPEDDPTPIELGREIGKPARGTMADDVPHRALWKRVRRRAARYRVVRTPLVIWMLAAIGFWVVFAWATRALKDVVEAQEKPTLPEPGPKPPERSAYKPLGGEAGVLIRLRVTPADARIFIDGAPAPSNPIRVPQGKSRHVLRILASGYAPRELKVTADRNQDIRVSLERLR